MKHLLLSIVLGLAFITAAVGQTPVRATNQLINARTGATYAIQNSDAGKLITACNVGAQAYSIAQATTSGIFRNGWFADIKNICAGAVTITPTVSTVDGAATMVLTEGQSARLVSNGTNYRTGLVGSLAPGGITNSAPANTIPVSDGTNLDDSGITWLNEILTLGNADVTLTVSGLRSAILVRAANGDVDNAGGDVSLISGSATGGDGGDISILTGADTGEGSSGALDLATGPASDGADGGGDTGSIGIRAGNGTVADSSGGDVSILAGQGRTDGGSIILNAGARTVSGSHGTIQFYAADGNTSQEINNSGFFLTTPGSIALGAPSIAVNATVTAAATTGAQTIDKAAGSVNFAPTDTSLVVTNSTVTATSIVICTVATNDSTLKSVQCVAEAGSFTMFANAAAAAETRVNFWVITPQ